MSSRLRPPNPEPSSDFRGEELSVLLRSNALRFDMYAAPVDVALLGKTLITGDSWAGVVDSSFVPARDSFGLVSFDAGSGLALRERLRGQRVSFCGGGDAGDEVDADIGSVDLELSIQP